MNTSTLAFLGDAFFELYVRRMLAEQGGTYAADRLHSASVRYVRASSQAKAVKGLLESGVLSDEEKEVVRKARNRKPKTVPKNADPVEYKLATAFEALLGFHYSGGRADRAEKLAGLAVALIDGIEPERNDRTK